MPTLPKLPFVEVHWDDAHNHATWETKDTVPKVAKCVTRGWVVKEDKEGITLAHTFSASAGEHDEDQFGGCETIPLGCITKRKRLRFS
ncbi:MAG: hypothetical protein AAGF48_12845 [Pseudomonadota bacterium]